MVAAPDFCSLGPRPPWGGGSLGTWEGLSTQQAWVLALAGKETFLMNLDQQNLAALEGLSRWKLPTTSFIPPPFITIF